MSPFSMQSRELVDRRVDDRGRHHQPDGTRRLELADELLEAAAGDGPFLDQGGSRLGMDVVDDAFLLMRISRRTMFDPIRPRPIMPSCIGDTLPGLPWPAIQKRRIWTAIARPTIARIAATLNELQRFNGGFVTPSFNART